MYMHTFSIYDSTELDMMHMVQTGGSGQDSTNPVDSIIHVVGIRIYCIRVYSTYSSCTKVRYGVVNYAE